jgi:predicted ATPase
MTMHLKRVKLLADRYPAPDTYPFSVPAIRGTAQVEFRTPVTFFVGENGTGKSTLLEALARRCGIHIWEGMERTRYQHNPFEDRLHEFLEVEWDDGSVPGSFFASQIFRNFAQLLDEMASADPGQLAYFGGQSLVTQSHGQSLMAFFRSRYRIRGLYLMDEPETALSPARQIELVQLLREMSAAGHAQFIVATHSPILLACPKATIFSFDGPAVAPIAYEDTEHYKAYKDFMADPRRFLPE